MSEPTPKNVTDIFGTPKDDIERYQDELDSYYAEMKSISDPAEMFQRLAAWSARASEIRTALVRRESRRAQAFRTREIEPFLEQCERMFKYYSRIVSTQQHEWEITKGAF